VISENYQPVSVKFVTDVQHDSDSDTILTFGVKVKVQALVKTAVLKSENCIIGLIARPWIRTSSPNLAVRQKCPNMS